ncbi:hypothetical protein M011DRAFT_483461 [Sporormia fimetaria CBS 119925]|uniref:N-acetyltransferase domain-containing protein n=1 Tax=Sporormia fimetaria CBS 119925 TaxID=1340428 RepID=A0A6A6VQL0_9PLEO|nr:hypothetical protein M011DRAFT_483461 [Sporormia fimetaria CBS 119925]
MSTATGTSPPIQQPTLLTPHDISSNSPLLNYLITFINAAFQRSKARFPELWPGNQKQRFQSSEELLKMLGDDGVMCVLYGSEEEEERANPTDSESKVMVGKPELAGTATPPHNLAVSSPSPPLERTRERKIIACAAIVPWTGGSSEPTVYADPSAQESGWEIKAVCVDASPRYAKTGLAVRMTEFLTKWAREKSVNGKVEIWIITGEIMQGDYWRRRGFGEVRRAWAKPGVWGAHERFEMVVLRKVVGG